jgi:hypothetical protein
MTFLHANIYDLSETSEILIRSFKLLVRIVQRVPTIIVPTGLFALYPCTILTRRLKERVRISDVSDKSKILAYKNVIRILQEFVWTISKNSDAMAMKK